MEAGRVRSRSSAAYPVQAANFGVRYRLAARGGGAKRGGTRVSGCPRFSLPTSRLFAASCLAASAGCSAFASCRGCSAGERVRVCSVGESARTWATARSEEERASGLGERRAAKNGAPPE